MYSWLHDMYWPCPAVLQEASTTTSTARWYLSLATASAPLRRMSSPILMSPFPPFFHRCQASQARHTPLQEAKDLSTVLPINGRCTITNLRNASSYPKTAEHPPCLEIPQPQPPDNPLCPQPPSRKCCKNRLAIISCLPLVFPSPREENGNKATTIDC